MDHGGGDMLEGYDLYEGEASQPVLPFGWLLVLCWLHRTISKHKGNYAELFSASIVLAPSCRAPSVILMDATPPQKKLSYNFSSSSSVSLFSSLHLHS
jgi:hypothetical protein